MDTVACSVQGWSITEGSKPEHALLRGCLSVSVRLWQLWKQCEEHLLQEHEEGFLHDFLKLRHCTGGGKKELWQHPGKGLCSTTCQRGKSRAK